MTWSDRYGPWALVTGASSGIGAEFVRQIAERGINVVLVARRQDRMETLARSVESAHAIATRVLPVDLLDEEACESIRDAVADLELGLLVNNAGYGMAGPFLTQDPKRQTDMVVLNCVVPVRLTQLLLPSMVERGRGGLIFIASTAAYQATPYLGVYGATKAFNLLVGESLWKEYGEVGIDSLALSPGFTRTEFAEVADIANAGAFRTATAESVVLEGLNSLGKRPSVIHGFSNKILAFFTRVLPRRAAIGITAATLKGRARVS